MGGSVRAPHEAMLYHKAEGGAVDCFLCAHRCHVLPGKRGLCRVRENRDGTLYSLVYGLIIAAHVDPIEKKPLYHFLPGTESFSIATVGCNFQCDFCQNWQISQAARAEELPGQYAEPKEIVAAAQRAECPSISYTYTEPTIYFEYAHDCARLAKEKGLRNIFVTNGYMTGETVEKMTGLIDAANVDLKAFTETFYHERCKGKLAPVCETIRRMREARIHLEVTTLLIPGFNDDEAQLREMAEFLAGVGRDIPWHVSRYHPDYQFDQAPATPVSSIARAIEIGRTAGLRYVYAGNVPGSACEDTHCPNCNAMLIEREGFIARVVGLAGGVCRKCGVALPIVQ